MPTLPIPTRSAPLWLALTLTLAACATRPALPPYDHADPAVLNEYALARAGAGDTGTALLLLERAALLAPHDAQIRDNLQALRDYRAGRSAAVPPGAPAAEQTPASAPGQTAADAMPPQPPALWGPPPR